MTGRTSLQVEATVDGVTALRPTVLHIDVDQIDVTTQFTTERDRAWQHTDAAGHMHAWADDDTLPTLTGRSEHRGCNQPEEHGGDCEGYEVTVYDCAICRDPVEPVSITEPTIGRRFIPGLSSWSVEVEADVPDRATVWLRTADGVNYFGVGQGVHWRAERGSDGIRQWTRLVGAGPLGKRRVPAVVPS